MHHTFTKDQINILSKNLSSLVVTGNNKLLETLKSEKNIVLNAVKTTKIDGDYIIDNKHLQLFKKQWLIVEEKNYKMFIDNMSNKGIDAIIKRKQKERDCISLLTHIKMKLLKQKMKLYNKMSITIDKSDYLTLTNYTIKNNLYTNTVAINNTIKDYFELIKNNNKLLQKLKENR
jgi:hypothetical protein